jgi:hypothetical protein
MIQIKWKRLLNKTGVWLTTEVLLNLIGLDNFADYSEFIFAHDLELYKKNNKTVKVAEFPPQFCPKIEEHCPIPGTVLEFSDLPAEYRDSKAKILQHKCKKLQHRCIKVICLSDSFSSVNVACSDND